MKCTYALALCVIAVIPFVTSLKCRECKNAMYLDDCDTVQVCSEDQICYMDEIVTDHVYYHGGCRSRSLCSPAYHERRSIEDPDAPLVACSRCCENETDITKMCNDRLCGLHRRDDALECYHCLDEPDVNKCYGTELCLHDQVCSAIMYSTNNGQRTYNDFQCRPRQMCIVGTTNQIQNFALFTKQQEPVGRRELLEIAERMSGTTKLCEVCCADPLCNTGICVHLLASTRTQCAFGVNYSFKSLCALLAVICPNCILCCK